MTICIDCRMIDASGIGVYLHESLPWLLQSNHDFLLLGNGIQLQPFASYQNVQIIECNTKPFSISELLFFPIRILQKINTADLFYSPYFNIPYGIKIPVYTTIHDIVFPDMPELISRTGLAMRMRFYRRAYKKSKKIFTVSEFSKSRITHHLGSEKEIIVTYSAIQSLFLAYRASAGNIQKKQTIIFVGNIKKHKGLDLLIDAFFLARKEGLIHKLIIVGSKEKFRTTDNSVLKKITSAGSDAVSFTGKIPNEQLIEYLAEASLLVQPSLYEGFGLPPLEAMVVGTPALVSDIPVFREIYGGFPVTFFRAGDSSSLKEKIMELLYNKKISSPVLSEKLLEQYTFEKTAATILRELE